MLAFSTRNSIELHTLEKGEPIGEFENSAECYHMLFLPEYLLGTTAVGACLSRLLPMTRQMNFSGDKIPLTDFDSQDWCMCFIGQR
jgi:hypothetical protein